MRNRLSFKQKVELIEEIQNLMHIDSACKNKTIAWWTKYIKRKHDVELHPSTVSRFFKDANLPCAKVQSKKADKHAKLTAALQELAKTVEALGERVKLLEDQPRYSHTPPRYQLFDEPGPPNQ